MTGNTKKERRRAAKKRDRAQVKKRDRDLRRAGKGPGRKAQLADIAKVFGPQAAAAVAHAKPVGLNADLAGKILGRPLTKEEEKSIAPLFGQSMAKEDAALSSNLYGRAGPGARTEIAGGPNFGHPAPLILSPAEAAAMELDLDDGTGRVAPLDVTPEFREKIEEYKARLVEGTGEGRRAILDAEPHPDDDLLAQHLYAEAERDLSEGTDQ